MKKLLIINVNITGNSPQPIRFRELIKYWIKYSQVTLLTMNNFKGHELDLGSSVRVLKAEYSSVGRLLISKNNIAEKQYIKSKKTFKRRVRELIRKLWRVSIFYRLMFPDKFIFEHPQIMRVIKNLKHANNDFDTVVISASPFSLLKLAGRIKRLFPNAHLIYDVGDPFYGNSGTELIKPLRTTFARRFEQKYLPDVDKLVVMSTALKRHYLKNFGNEIMENNIHVIDQGYYPIFKGIPVNRKKAGSELKLIYAGGLYKDLREPFSLYEAVRNYQKSKINLRIFGNIHKDFLPEDNDQFYYGGSIPASELYKEYENCDVMVFIDNKSGIQVPGKILELTGIKRPILFIYENPNSPTLEYIEGNGAIVKCSNNEMEIKEALYKIEINYNSFVYTEINEEYSWPHLAEKYLKEVL